MNDHWDKLLSPSNENDTLWELFHHNSKCSKEISSNSYASKIKAKTNHHISLYRNFPAIQLPDTPIKLEMPLVDAIQKRVSKQNVAPNCLTLVDISTLLTYSYSLQKDKSTRYAPSAGALYPIEIYFHFSPQDSNSDLPSGLYYYDLLKSELRQLISKNCDSQIQNILMQPELVKNSVMQIFLTAAFFRSTQKYGDRGYRFIHIEAGHIAQNINLVATAMNLSSINIGGYYEDEANRFLKIDSRKRSVIYMTLISQQL
jgi:SagB-type dehydrogenase family enzyme